MTLLLVMLCTMGAWADQTPVSLTSDGNGGWYIDMPAKDAATSVENAAVLTLTADDISAGKGTFKVYDDGGKSGVYSHSYNGYLIVTTPEGYKVQLSGSVATESGYDYLRAYDGTTTDNRLGEENYTGSMNVGPLRSSNQSMLLYFHSDGSSTDSGLNLMVKAVSPYMLMDITGLSDNYDYNNGNAIDVTYTVTDYNGDAIDPIHYNAVITKGGATVTTVAAKGMYTLTITGIAPYIGTLTANFWVKGTLAGTGTVNDPYLIGDDNDWHVFAEKVNGGETTACAKLSADITTAITDMVGTSSNKYQGIFDGNGHTLTLGLATNEAYCAPFRYTDGAIIKRLRLTGSIETSAKYAASIVASAGNTFILNCWSSVNINSTYNGWAYHGGIVSSQSSSLNLIDHVLFDGSMTGTGSQGCAGISYSSSVIIRSSLFEPTSFTIDHGTSGTFVNSSWLGDGSEKCYYKYADYSDLNYKSGNNALSYTNEKLAEYLGQGWSVSGEKVIPDLSAIYIPTSGKYTNNKEATWSISDDYKTLTFAGTGEIVNYSSEYYRPTFIYKGRVTSVVIPEGITSIGNICHGFGKLTTVNFPASLTTIGGSAFYSCGGLTAITIPATVTAIGDYAFYNCGELDVTLGHTTTAPEVQTYSFQSVTGTLNVQNTNIFNQVSDQWGYGTWTVNCLNPSVDFAEAVVTGVNSVKATGEPIVVTPKVFISGKEVDAANYDLSYTLNGNSVATIQAEGTYTVTATAKGSYTGTVSTTFAVLPANITYLDENGAEQTCSDYTILTSDMTNIGSYDSNNPTWYVAAGDLTFDHRITSYSTNLILFNGATLNATKGIYAYSYKTTIFAQSDDAATMGHLIAQGTKGNVAIGGNSDSYSGTIVINGGKIDATGSSVGSISPAIGIYYYNASCNITINGGIVTATSGNPTGNVYAICATGSSSSGGSITINGGQVTAVGQYGIGGKNTTSINLGWKKATDFIQADRYMGVVTLQKAFLLSDGTTIATANNIAGEKITPVPNVNDLTYASVTVATIYEYNNGKAVVVEPVVKSADGITLTKDIHYTLTYKNSSDVTVAPADLKEKGSYTMTISAIAPYTGSRVLSFRIGNGEDLDGYSFSYAEDAEGKYYEIGSESDLKQLAAYVNSGHEATGLRFKQTTDIAMNDNHQAIGGYDGSNNRYFKGTFDGNGKTITGLTINKPNDNNQGLFGEISNAVIKNVTLIDANITGRSNVGGIVGYGTGGSDNKNSIDNCKVLNGTIAATAGGATYHGGIVGYSYYIDINNCVVSGTISTAVSNEYYGGIIGYAGSYSTITNCENAASIVGEGNNHGGILGFEFCSSNFSVSGCLNTGTVEGSSNVGGIAGHIDYSSNYTNNYYAAPCTVKALNGSDYNGHAERVLGTKKGTNMAGISSENAVITSKLDGNLYFKSGEATLTLTANIPAGYSFVKYASAEAEVGNASVIDGEHALTIGNTDITISALVSSNNATDLSTVTIADIPDQRWEGNVAITPALNVTLGSTPLVLGTDYFVEWTDNAVVGEATLTLTGINNYKGSVVKHFNIVDFALLDPSKSNSSSNPYLIATAEDLKVLATIVNNGSRKNGYYKQTANITLTEDHIAIGNYNNRFQGNFDGDGKTISGLTINMPTADYQGLFGYTNSATIKNVVIDDCDITAKQYVGGVIGYSYDTSVDNCRVSGAIKTAAEVTGSYHGGIIGYSYWYNTTNCFNAASVTGKGSCYGGIVGYQGKNSITNSINVGIVEGTSYVGSIAGNINSDVTLSNNHHLPSTTGGIGSYESTVGTDREGADLLFTIAAGANTQITATPFVWETTNYYYNGMELTLSYELPAGKFFDQYTVSNGIISNPFVIDGKHTLSGVTEGVITLAGSHTDKMTLANEAVTVNIGTIPYTGSAITVAPIVKRLDATLVQGTDYTITTEPAVVQAAGEYTMTVTGKGNYTGTKVVTFYVKEAILIKNAEEWATFAANVNAGTDCDGYYKLDDNFDNTTAAVTATVGTEAHPFTGLFDGNGKTLTVNINETSTQGTAPFREIVGATIKNLTVNGSVTGTTHAAGLVGFARSGVNYIDNCVVNTNVSCSTGSNRHIGGVVGHGIQSTVNISNTVYTGTLSNNTYAGGLLGWSDGSNLNITHCLVTGSKNGSYFHPIAIKNNTAEMKSVNVDDVFYTHDATLTDDNYIAATGTKVYEGAQEAFCKKRWTLNEKDYYSKETAVIGNVDDLIEYTGSAITLTPTVTYEGTALTADTDFTFATDPATVQEKGEYTLTVTGQGNYAGTQSMKFHVVGGVLDGEGTEADPYLITSVDDWNKFAGNISSGDYNYSGKFVKMTEDMTVSTMAGNSEANSFQGTFLGTAGKTMTLNLTATAENCAPFGYLKNATIKDLTIAGTISTGFKYAGTIAAHTYGTTHIQNCISTAEITSTFETSADATHGGFVALNEGSAKLYFNNCVFAGKLLGANATSNGGFLGWNGGSTINYTDCLFAPAEITMSTSSSATFNRNGNNSFTRAYYLTQYGDAQGVYVVTIAPANDVYTTVEATDAKTYYALCDITGLNDFYSYTGNAVAVNPVVKLGSNTTLTKGTDYTVTIKNSSDVVVDPEDLKDLGNYTITIEGIGNYTGSRTIAFRIVTTENIGGYVFEIGTDDEGKYYKVATATDFENLKACVNSADNTTASMRFKQTANITVSSMMGTSENRSFQGVYDGQGNTLTLDITATQNIAGPFRYIKGATIKNITIAGAIKNSGKQNGGVAGYSYGDVTISNCTVNASITSSFNGDASNGGFIAHIQTGSAIFNDCVFTGRLLGESANCSAGFVGWRDNTNIPITFNNCLVAPAEVTMGASGSATFNRNKTDNNTYTNSYYLTSYGEVQGAQVVTTVPSANVYKTVKAADGNTYHALCDITGVERLYLNTGSAIDVTPVVKLLDATLTAGTDYTFAFAPAEVIANGDYTITVTGTGNYAGSQPISFRVVEGENLGGYVFETATDEEGRYYVIAEEADLENLAAYVNSEHTAEGKRFKQTADITMTAEHTAIGRNNSSKFFKGTFDGNGKSINNLYINKTGTDNNNDSYQGLFGYISYATVKNVNIVDCNITGYYDIAGIAGYNYYGTVSNCTVSGSIQKAAGRSPNNVAGIVGYNSNGTITDCVNHATVSGHNWVGGISGDNSGTIKNCINDGVVTGTGTTNIGSIAARKGASFSNNYYPAGLGLTGGVGAQNVATGTDQPGAEVMFTITAGNAATHLTTEPVKEYNSTKYYKNGMELTMSYDVPDGKFFDQYTVSNGTITNPYDIDGKHILSGVTENITITGSHTDKMDVASNAVTVRCGIIPYTGDVITVAPVVERVGVTLVQGTDYEVSTTPAVVQAAGAYTLTITGKGNYTGTKQTTFYVKEATIIKNATEWATFAENVNNGTGNDGYYKLADDFDNSTAVTATVGTGEHPFTGLFDGNGKTLNVEISETSTQGTAPFREIVGATIKNLTVNGSVTGTTHAAGLVGFARSGVNFIENCVVNTNVTCSTGSNRHIGGVVGHGIQSTVNISNTIYTGTLNNSQNYAGGLLGWSDGGKLNITHCLVTGSKSGNGKFHPIAVKNNTAVMEVNVDGAFYTHDATLTDDNYIAATGKKVYAGVQTAFCKKESTFGETDYYSKESVVIGNVDNTIGYTGDEITLAPTVTYEGTALTADTEFTFATDPAPVQEKGEYTLTVTGQGIYAGTQSMKFHVVGGVLDGEGTEASPYLIATVADWNKFAGNINSGNYNYGGQFVKMTDDITVSTMAGNSEANSFQGTFLGTAGKTMTLNLTAATDGCAPFGYLKNATIKDLTIAGTVTTGYKFGASIAAHTYGTTNIKNCISTVEIISTFEESADGTHGGFVALNESSAKLYFNNSVFAGKLLGANAHSNGGFVGWTNGNIYYTDCLFAPAEITMSTNSSYTFNRNGRNSFTRAYYLTAFGTSHGVIAYTSENVPATGLFGQITAADGNTYYVQGSVGNINDSYAYTGAVININPTYSISNESVSFVKDTDFEVTITKDGNPVAEVLEFGDYVFTISAKDGGKCKGSFTKNVNVYGAVPTNFKWSEVTASTATLVWDDNTGTNWTVELSENSDFSTLVESRDVTAKTVTFEDLTAETDYYARVQAVYGEVRSNWSATCSVQPSTKQIIGSGTATSGSVPFNNFYYYNMSQQIYTPAELGNKAGSILSIDIFRTDNNTCYNTIDVYLVNTSKSSFENNTDWMTVTDADKVFSGRVDFPSNAWGTITLDTPFDYDGTSNLAMVIYHHKNGQYSYGSGRNFRVFTGTGNQSIWYNSDSTDPTLNPTIGGSTGTSKNQLRIRFAEKINMNEHGIMTYASDNVLDFSNVSDLTAHYASSFTTNHDKTGVLTMTQAEKTPAGEGLMLRGTAGETFYVPVLCGINPTISNNLMVGLTTATPVNTTDGDYTNYILSKQNDVIGWYPLAAAYTLKAHSAYLKLLTTDVNAARGIAMDFGDGETTGIAIVDNDQTDKDAWYTVDGKKLDGQPVKKGLYIHNGRKTVIK